MIVRTVSSKLFQGATRAVAFVRGYDHPQAFDLSLVETALAIPVGLSYLYKEGNRARDGRPSASTKWFAAMTEGGLVGMILQKATEKIYVLSAMAWAAYEMGTEKTSRDKMKALIKASVLFPMAYFGLNSGLGLSDSLRSQSAQKLSEEAKVLLDQLKAQNPAQAPQIAREFKSLIESLENNAKSLIQQLSSDKKELSVIQKVTAAFQKSQISLLEKYGATSRLHLSKLPGGRAQLEKVVSLVNNYRGYEWLRKLNGPLGYIAGLVLAGAPLSRYVSQSILIQDPSGVTTDKTAHMAPLWLDRVLANVGVNIHGPSAPSVHPYLSVDGPALLNDSWNGRV